ncbi:hypothetical protein [Scytonema sp. NUACC26]|uniref:hypothetical protein n=1 Tax=Scytonema sp. NUACC26 TaxID=3140176 RepID=UPI0034DC1DF4
MSPDEQNIKGLVKLIQSLPSLFSSEDQISLWKLVNSLPNDAEQISNAIAEWTQERKDIRSKLLPFIAQSSNYNVIITRGPSEDPEPVNPKDYKNIIINAMREVSFQSETQQPSSQPSPQPKPSDSPQ